MQTLAWISAAFSSRKVSWERPLKALGNNAFWWRHESNVVIYEISHATFTTKAFRQNQVLVDVIHLRLLITDCMQYLQKKKLF